MADRIEVWTVSTFNVVGFGLVLLLVGHLSGALSDALGGLGTLPGLLVFGYLWGLSLYATRWALRDDGLTASEGRWPLLKRGSVAGAGIGSAFLVGIVIVGATSTLVAGNPQLLPFAIVGLVGGVVSALVGALLGVAFVLVDLLCYRLALSMVGE